MLAGPAGSRATLGAGVTVTTRPGRYGVLLVVALVPVAWAVELGRLHRTVAADAAYWAWPRGEAGGLRATSGSSPSGYGTRPGGPCRSST